MEKNLENLEKALIHNNKVIEELLEDNKRHVEIIQMLLTENKSD